MRHIINLIFLGVGLTTLEAKSQESSNRLDPDAPNLLGFQDYIAPTLQFNGTMLDIIQKWPAAQANSLAAGALRSQLFSLLFAAPAIALNERYQQALSQMIKQVGILPKGLGQLSFVSYTKDEFGVVDVNSLRISNKGIGGTPEESYAFGTSNMTIPYEATQYGDVQGHYIWIFKDTTGKVLFGTIREPFIDAFRQRAFAYRENILENVKTFELQGDKIIESYRVADKWISIAERHKQLLEHANVWNKVNSLNLLMKQKQDELNRLNREASEIAAKRQVFNCIMGFIDACETFNNAAGELFEQPDAGEKASYKFQSDYLKPQQAELQKNINRLGIDINGIQMRLRPIYKSQTIATPDSDFKPKQIIQD